MPTAHVQRHDLTPESLRRTVSAADAVADELAVADEGFRATAATGGPVDDETFPARPAARCGWCDVRPACSAGRAAAPAQLPWAGLES